MIASNWKQLGVFHLEVIVPRKLTLEEVGLRLRRVHNEAVCIIPETFQGCNKKATFKHSVYGLWEAEVRSVLRGCSHPQEGDVKRAATNLERYGHVNPFGGASVKEKIKNTNIERYGVASPSKNQQVQEKTKRTNMERFGVCNPLSNKDVQERVKNTNIERYGAEYAAGSIEVQRRIKHTNLERYGATTCLNSSEVRQKIYNTNVEKTGVKTPFENPRVQRRVRESTAANGSDRRSEQEHVIEAWLNSIGIKTTHGCIDGYIYDIVIETSKTVIEYNGLYWHTEVMGRGRNHHYNKMMHANKNGYNCINVFEHEWEDSNAQVKSFLRSALGANTRRLHMRKLVAREISKQEALLFVDTYHIQRGSKRVSLAIGIFDKDELVAVGTFGAHHRKTEEVVLNRWCAKEDVTIAGALSKVMKMALLHFKKPILSWCDLRWSQGKGYEAAGWVKDEVLPPDYFYYGYTGSNKGRVVSKQSRQKSLVSTPEGMTESEHAALDGFTKVWDCGKIRYKFGG